MGRTQREFEDMIQTNGYSAFRQLPDGRYIGVRRFMFTYGLCVGLDWEGYSGRYCYPDPVSAITAAIAWDGEGDPEGPWIKYKGVGGERSNPQGGDDGPQ